MVRASASSHCRVLLHSAPPSSLFPIPNINAKNPKMGMSEHFDTKVIRRKKEEMSFLPGRHAYRSDASESKSLNFNSDKRILALANALVR